MLSYFKQLVSSTGKILKGQFVFYFLIILLSNIFLKELRLSSLLLMLAGGIYYYYYLSLGFRYSIPKWLLLNILAFVSLVLISSQDQLGFSLVFFGLHAIRIGLFVTWVVVPAAVLNPVAYLVTRLSMADFQLIGEQLLWALLCAMSFFGLSILIHQITMTKIKAEHKHDRIQLLLKELEISYKKMEELAVKDCVTGLYNHRFFLESIEQFKDVGYALILLDLDNFKGVNDTYGHPIGDQVLRELGRLMKDNIRDQDIPCRCGGDEFAVILPGLGKKQAMQIADRIRQKIADAVINFDEHTITGLTISGGVAEATPGTENPREIMKKADKALYQAKGRGKNIIVDLDL